MHSLHLQLLLLLIPMVSSQVTLMNTTALFGIPQDMWRCGTGAQLTNDVIRAINNTCPLAAADFNHCCAVHDECYSNQRGQKKCDDEFCGCLQHHVANDEEAAKCGNFVGIACEAVKSFGSIAYHNSETLEETPIWIPQEIPHISREYANLYHQCDDQKVTLSSCALNHDLCYRNPSPTPSQKPKEGCILGLLRCLDDVKNGRDLPNKECDVAIEMVLWKIVERQETENINNNILVQEIMLNKTFVQRVYLQLVRTTSSFSWIAYLSFCLALFICCIFLAIGLTCTNNNHKNDMQHLNDDVINVRVTSSTASGGGTKSTTSDASELSTKKH